MKQERPSETILVIEDDASLRLSLQVALRSDGYQVRVANDGAEGLDLALGDRPNLVLLDVMMPKMNGFEVLTELRKHDPVLPILLVTAKDAEEDRVRGLRLGADDYVLKPFSTAELLARVSAALRRTRIDNRTKSQVTIGLLTLDFFAQTAKDPSGAPVDLTSLEFKLLRYFLDNEGRLLSRERILAAVWGADYFGTERTVDNFVNRLRSKLDDSRGGSHLVTVRGGGYRFSKEVSR
jgi:two-component system, OmpR family, alkaline phosphatase synthesis response regulator PhoP